MADTDPVAELLRNIDTTDDARANAWDAFHQSSSTDEFTQKLKAINLPDTAKADLWDLKQSAAPAQGGDVLLDNIKNVAGKAVDWLPEIGGAVGGFIGGAGGTVAGFGVGGVPGAIGGAVIGGAAGEAAKQLVNRATGRAPAPSTPVAAASGIATQGAVQGAAQGVGAGAGAVLNELGPKLMQSALKPTIAVLKEYGTTPERIATTLLKEGVNVTDGGMAKLQGLLGANQADITAAVRSATGTIAKQDVAARTVQTAEQMAEQTNPTADLKAVKRTVKEFMNHPVIKGPTMSIPEAQAMKVGTYKRIGENYGEISSAAIETQKALARGLKEEIAAAVPQIQGLNMREADLLAALDAVGRRAAISANRDPIGFAWVAHAPQTFLAALIDRNPTVKSLIARGAYGMAGQVAHVAPQTIRAAVHALAASDDSAPAPDQP